MGSLRRLALRFAIVAVASTPLVGSLDHVLVHQRERLARLESPDYRIAHGVDLDAKRLSALRMQDELEEDALWNLDDDVAS